MTSFVSIKTSGGSDLSLPRGMRSKLCEHYLVSTGRVECPVHAATSISSPRECLADLPSLKSTSTAAPSPSTPRHDDNGHPEINQSLDRVEAVTKESDEAKRN